MARYIDADALIAEIKRIYCTDCNNYNEIRCRACGTDDSLRMLEDAPEADVAPKSEVAKGILLDLRRKMHDKAVFPYSEGAYSYVSLKVADAIINEFLNKYTEVKKQ